MAARVGTALPFDIVAGTSQAVTVPATATGMVVFWGGYDGGGQSSINSMTLDGDTFTVFNLQATQSEFYGCAVLALPSTGAQTLSWTRTELDAEGTGLIVFVNAVDTANMLRDQDGVDRTSSGTNTATVNSATDDLVIAQHLDYNANPVTGSGQTEFVSNDTTGVSYRQDGFQVDSPGGTTTNAVGTTGYGSLVAVSLRNAAGGASTTKFLSLLGTG